MTTVVISEAPSTVVVDDDARSDGLPSLVITSGIGPPGPKGARGDDAQVSLTITAIGPYAARAAILPAPVLLVGAGNFTAGNSKGQAFSPADQVTIWSATLNGTFVSESAATDDEIAAALFATITFPAGPGLATWHYPTGGGFDDGDVLRVWESPTPSATQAHTSLTFGGTP